MEKESEQDHLPKEDSAKVNDITPELDEKITDSVVDDIERQESDELLKAKDEEIEKAFDPPKSKWQSFRKWCNDIWDEPKYRWSIIVGTVAFFLLVFLIPPTRYFVFNTIGFRGSLSIKVVDDKTEQPLKNVNVNIRGKSAKTDDSGTVKIEKIKLGTTKLEVDRVAYATIRQNITIGLGANDLGTKQMNGVGVRLLFRSIDWLSKNPVEKVEASVGESSAFSDSDGKIELVLEPSSNMSVDINFTAKNYLKKTATVNMDDKSEIETQMVVDYPHYFVSKRSGKYDLYKINMDRSDEKLILAGTGTEREQTLDLSSNNSHSYLAFVSQRENERNKDGYQMETLNLIKKSGDEVKKITNSEDVRLVGWTDKHLVYVKIAAGASGQNASRYRLISYELENGKELELASSNYFVDVVMINDAVYYVPSDFYRSAVRGLYRVKPDGSNKAAIVSEDTWSLFRTDVDQLTIQTPDKWYKYTIGETNPQPLTVAPNNPVSISFFENSDYSKSLWKDDRDGKGALLIRDMSNRKDNILVTKSGLDKALGWAGEKHVVFRVVNPTETADYIISSEAGEAIKIQDVVNVGSDNNSYY